jgi:hypothetical protein
MMSASIVAVITRVISTQSKTTHCSRCGSSKTKLCYLKPIIEQDGSSSIIIRKYKNWNKGMCMNCYNKYISNPKHNPIHNPKRIRFKDKRFLLKQQPRIGVCNTCRAIVNQVDAQLGALCKKTDMNHFAYDSENPLKHTLEQCTSCHRHFHKNNKRRQRGGA